MVEGFFIILSVLFCIMGAVWFIQQLALYIASPTAHNRAYIVFLSGENADIELELAISTLSWSKAFKRTTAFAIDMGLCDETREKCEKLIKNSKFIFIDKNDFPKIMGQF